jgi:hypothetical protein
MRSVTGGSCRTCDKASDAVPVSIIVPIPNVPASSTPIDQVQWGFMVQVVGRAESAILIAKSSRPVGRRSDPGDLAAT